MKKKEKEKTRKEVQYCLCFCTETLLMPTFRVQAGDVLHEGLLKVEKRGFRV